MFTIGQFVHIDAKINRRDNAMGTAKAAVVHKHFRLDAAKLKRAQKLLDAATETETVERAIDLAILEHERNRIANRAHDRFVLSKATVRDVYGVLE
jgi:signal transduction histidine kinase